MELTTPQFFTKSVILLVTYVVAMISGAFAIWSDMTITRALTNTGYALAELVVGGGVIGALIWGIGASLFGTTTRAAGRALVLIGIYATAICIYLWQFNLPSDTSWGFFFWRQHPFVLALLGCGFVLSFPFLRLGKV